MFASYTKEIHKKIRFFPHNNPSPELVSHWNGLQYLQYLFLALVHPHKVEIFA